MTRALFIATVPEHLTAFHLPFVEHFRSKGWRVDGMARDISNCSTCTTAFDRIWDVDFSRNPLDSMNLMRAPRLVRQVLQETDYDLIHVHTPVAAFVVRYALRKMKSDTRPKVIYTAHGFHFYRGGNPLLNGIYLTLEKLAGKWTDYLVVMNQEDLQAAKKHRIVPSDRVTYMPGIGLDTSYYNNSLVPAEEVASLKQELGIGPDGKLFLMVAEFIPRKRHEDVLRAFARLGRADTHLAFAGVGTLLEQMQSLSRELNIDDRVHFLGFRRDIPVLVKASAAVVLPSLHEGLPRCLMESLCLEVPCIGSRIRGTSDLLDGNKGLLVDVGDIDGLRSAMSWVLDEPEQAKAMAARGKARMEEYDIGNIVRLHETLYQRALAS